MSWHWCSVFNMAPELRRAAPLLNHNPQERLTKREVESHFRHHVLPPMGVKDGPAVREVWNDYIDALHRDGQITSHQADTWSQPAFVKRRRR